MILKYRVDTEDWYDECIHYNRKQLFLNVIILTVLQFLLYFWSNKCSLGKHKGFFQKHKKNLTEI